jgi:hypothetical protein
MQIHIGSHSQVCAVDMRVGSVGIYDIRGTEALSDMIAMFVERIYLDDSGDRLYACER